MCTQLDALVVAEGIETVQELDAVIAAGAHYGQGYLLARPAFRLPRSRGPRRASTPQVRAAQARSDQARRNPPLAHQWVRPSDPVFLGEAGQEAPRCAVIRARAIDLT